MNNQLIQPTNESVTNKVILQLPKAVRKKKRWENPISGYLFISPWLLGFLLLTLWPMVQSLYFSFTDYSLMDSAHWIGLQNFAKMLDDKKFINSVKVTTLFVVISVPLKLLFSLLLAMLLNQKLKGMYVYRTVIYFPSLIGSSIAVAILWSNIFGKDGFLNHVLAVFGIEGRSWIGDPSTALGTLILLVIWQFGSSMVIFLAGLKQISGELYEAASVDGATKITQFFRITLPMLSPTILFNLVLQVIGSFQMFTQAFIITKGGPIQSTNMFALYLYEQAFVRFHMGYASAMAWTFLLLIALCTAFIFITSKSWVYYESEGGRG